MKYYNQNNTILHLVLDMAPSQAAALIGPTELSSSAPRSSDGYAQLLTAGNFEIISNLENVSACALCTIISLIAHKNNISQTVGYQFSCELFQSCLYDPKQRKKHNRTSNV